MFLFFNGISYVERGEREDIYQLGLILLETITGKSVESQEELDVLRVQVQYPFLLIDCY